MNVEIGAEAAQFSEKEYTNGIDVAVCNRRDACNSRVCSLREGSQQQNGNKQQQEIPTSERKFTLRGSTATSTATLQAGLEATGGTPANEGMPTAPKPPWQQVEMSRNASFIKEEQDISKQQGLL
jgi:hypothetical protein